MLNLERALAHFLAIRGAPRDELRSTADRWIRMMDEMTEGRHHEISRLFKTFDGIQYEGMVVLGGIPFTSLCEHHLLPFSGRAWVGYLPNARTGHVVGISKLARLVDAHARRLQVQERLTQNVANDIMVWLKATGAGVRIKSTHACMSCRGIKKDAEMSTQSLLGAFMRAEVRQEFYELCKGDSNG